MKIGIPRALLYYNYRVLWTEFFKILGVETIVSPETNKQIISMGNKNSIDEACYSSKIYIGHVAWLIGKCDKIFVPRFENTGIREDYCTRIIGIYDLVRNTFPDAPLLHADTNYLFRKKEQDAYISIGEQLGFPRETALTAYQSARTAHLTAHAAEIAAQDALLNTSPRKILLITHPYNAYDAAIGKNIAKYFADNNTTVIYAHLVADPPKTPRMYWKTNADLMAGFEKYRPYVDGIILISTFPCGPDSIFNEMILRTPTKKPTLNITIDELDATAGLLTRLESFLDILEARQ